MQDLIVNTARDLFFSHGLKNTSMEDIARAAALSKNTIYQSFTNKNEILGFVVKSLLQCHEEKLQRCTQAASNPLEEVLMATDVELEHIALINQNFFYDLEKSFPDIWMSVTNHRKAVLLPSIRKNLQKGIECGHYRHNLDLPFVAGLRLQQIVLAFNERPAADSAGRSPKLLSQLTEFYLYAITTGKGQKIFINYLNANNERKFSN